MNNVNIKRLNRVSPKDYTSTDEYAAVLQSLEGQIKFSRKLKRDIRKDGLNVKMVKTSSSILVSTKGKP